MHVTGVILIRVGLGLPGIPLTLSLKFGTNIDLAGKLGITIKRSPHLPTPISLIFLKLLTKKSGFH